MLRKPAGPTLILAALAVIGAPAFVATEAQASDPFIAEIKMFAGNFAPRAYAFCDGQLLAVNSYTALFSLVGATYGGDGRSTFGLPDMRGRTAVHPGTVTGHATVSRGSESGGSVTLTVSNMPSHVHQSILHATSTDGNEEGLGSTMARISALWRSRFSSEVVLG